jgi:Uncharacterized conserved protein (DUF2075)
MPAYYRATLAEFLQDDPKRIVGLLTVASSDSGFNELLHRQTKAWQREIEMLRETAASIIAEDKAKEKWTLLLEYPIPRRRGRVDAVLLATDIIFCIEFKTEEKQHNSQTDRQAEDYALDLRDFHEQSNGRCIIPFAVAAKADTEAQTVPPEVGHDAVRPVWRTNAPDLAAQILIAFKVESDPTGSVIDGLAWDLSPYRPVPTIVEAAEALFAGHNVREIAHSHAGAINLTKTSDKLINIIERAQREGLKVACFVTGIPGAGKTLAGLNVVHNPALRGAGRPSPVFLSGNGPLVKIVSAAITRDFKRREQTDGADRTVSTFIQNVHRFVREAIAKPDKPPIEHVVVFDEAQRAWDAAQNKKKMDQDISEPETMLSIMDRHADWAVLVALVGGGQEIHNGEAGLAEWGRTLRDKFSHWKIAVSPNAISGDSSVAGHKLFENGESGTLSIQPEPELHLGICLRSFRAEKLSEWVEAVLCGNPDRAASMVGRLTEFPMVITRSLSSARAWLQERTRGFRRCGLVASSGAIRLRPYGLELSSGFRQGNRDMFVHWFLDNPPDVRSSNQLEVAASEFECQGLELDWVGLCWGGDFTFNASAGDWSFRNFAGTRWGEVRREIDRRYLLNTYRVLLTRAREGLVIWVPAGDATDHTRPPSWFDSTAEYLKRCGLREI